MYVICRLVAVWITILGMALDMVPFVLFLGVLCRGTTVGSESVGGIRLRVSQSGLNKAVNYWLINNIKPYIQHLDVGEVSFEIVDTSIIANKIKVTALDAVFAHVDLKGSDVIDIDVEFTKLVLSTNITFVYTSAENQYGPDTTLSFRGSKVQLSFSLGAAENPTSVNLRHCNVAIGDMSAGGELGNDIDAFLNLYDGELVEFIQKLCPYLRNESERYLTNILDLQESFEVILPNGKQKIKLQTTSFNADENLIRVVAAVTLQDSEQNTVYGSNDVSFPAEEQSMDKDIDVSLNLQLINEWLNQGVDTLALLNTTLENIKEFPDVIDTSLSIISSHAEVTDEGISLDGSANISFIQRSDQTVLFMSSFTAILPITMIASEEELRAIPDTSRKQLSFKILQQNLNGMEPEEIKQLQWNILSTYKDKIAAKLQDDAVNITLPSTDLFGFENTLLQTSQGLLRVSANLRVGPSQVGSQPTIRYHRKYSSDKFQVIFLDGETKTNETSSKPMTTGGNHLGASLCIPIVLFALIDILKSARRA